MPRSKKNNQEKVKKTGKPNSKLLTDPNEELKQLKQGISDLSNYFFPSDEELEKSTELFKPLIPSIPELQPTAEEIIEHQIITEQNKIDFAFILIAELPLKTMDSREMALLVYDLLAGENLHPEHSELQLKIANSILVEGKVKVFQFNCELNNLLEKNSIVLS